jgi:hypothetical protein
MKTPMQEVYENFNKMSDADFKAWMLNTDLLKKEKEVAQQYAKFAIECDRKELPVLEFDGWINLNTKEK